MLQTVSIILVMLMQYYSIYYYCELVYIFIFSVCFSDFVLWSVFFQFVLDFNLALYVFQF